VPPWLNKKGKVVRMEKWQIIDFESCPECGSDIEVMTIADEGFCYDGDSCRCVECDFKSGMSVDEDGSAWIQDV
jgi:hypothetical protein